MATAELAAVLPALVALVLVAVGLLAAAAGALRCEDAARLGARSVARGDPVATAVALSRGDAPADAAVALAPVGAGMVRVTVRETVRMPGPLGGLLPAWTVSGTATALDEATS
jgi:hypothetical protein